MSSNISDTMSSGFYVPDSLKFYVNKLSFSKNRVKLQALSSQVANPNGQIIVRLPSNTMLNMASLTMTGSVRASISAAADNEGVALPTNLDYSFIESISIIANGGVISQPFLNYKLIANVLNDVYGGDEKIDNRAALQGSRPSLLYDYLSITNTTGAASAYVPISINSWLSPLQSMSPSYINTNLLGDLEVRITLTDTSILQSASTALPAAAFAGAPAGGAAVAGLQARCSYDMKDIAFYIETASIQSNILDQAIDAKLRSGEPINIPFENIFSFQQTNNGASFNQRFSVSSQSINKVIAVTQLQADVVNDGTQKRMINGTPQALRRNSNGAQQCQFSINNQYSPNYQINSDLTNAFDFGLNGTFAAGSARNYQQSSGLIETIAALDIPDYDYESAHHKLCSTTQMPIEFGLNAPLIGGAVANITQIPKQGPAPVLVAQNNDTYWFPYTYQSPIDTYLYDKYVVATSFDLHCDSSRLISGVNTLGSNSQLFYNVVGGASTGVVPAASVSTIFVLCTSMIQVFAGSQLKIIQ
jgi:hypothetical protein